MAKCPSSSLVIVANKSPLSVRVTVESAVEAPSMAICVLGITVLPAEGLVMTGASGGRQT